MPNLSEYLSVAIFSLFVILMTIAAPFDLQIAQWMYQPESRFGNFMADFGELPAFGVILVGLALIFRHESKIELKAFAIGLLVVLLGYFVYDLWGESFSLWITRSIMLLVLIPLTLILISGQSPNEQLTSAWKVIITGIAHPLLLVQLIKLTWGRIRFRDLDPQDFEGYTAWFLPQGFTGNYSFPSGHTSMGMMVITLMYFSSSNRQSISLALFAGVYAIGMAISRMLVGAHYLSDVTFSLFTGILMIQYLLKKPIISSMKMD